MQAIRGNRLHVGIFGRRNSGKSSFINALLGQDVAIISDVAGTTADPVYKNMEIHGIGPLVIIDTAGFDDVGDLGNLRVLKTRQAAEKTDVAIMVFAEEITKHEREWVSYFKEKKVPLIAVQNKTDLGENAPLTKEITELCGISPLLVSAKDKTGFQKVRDALRLFAPEETQSMTGRVAKAGDRVMLVMPQDESAPRGRLIMPQVQTIRELLDAKCVIYAVTPETMQDALENLKTPPDLIITDSQVFSAVHEMTPANTRLTSFSVLLAGVKGDSKTFLSGTAAIDRLTESSRVLIAEACSHAPASEDIGRVKIPALLRKKAGEGLRIDVVAGDDFPSDLKDYDLIIHCGACMFNRRHVMRRILAAEAQNVPITNYGMVLAKLGGILDKIYIPTE